MSGWHVDAQSMNNFMHVSDIFLLAPRAICLQRMLDVCFDFSIRNNIKFNIIRSGLFQTANDPGGWGLL